MVGTYSAAEEHLERSPTFSQTWEVVSMTEILATRTNPWGDNTSNATVPSGFSIRIASVSVPVGRTLILAGSVVVGPTPTRPAVSTVICASLSLVKKRSG